MNYNFFTINDDIYPKQLKEIYNPPQKIYYLGDLNLLKNERLISIVGTRNCSPYGSLACEKIVEKLVAANVTIVSGFARGIDTIAHKTALKNKGKTIAVVANGLDLIYPASNINLYKTIEKNGLILSEYEIGTKPYKSNFPSRNRIIAGLSRATVMVESKEKGGSLITANLALDFNRDVYAVPNDIFTNNSKGCNNLIRDCGAKLLTNADEILEDYAWLIKENNSFINKNNNLNEIQNKILSSLNTEKTLDNIIKDTKLSLNDILSEIMQLEILGYIKALTGGKYKKII